MKFIRINGGEIGLLVELPTGPHVVDIAKSLSVLAAHDPLSETLIKGALKETSVWIALVKNWRYLRMPLAILVRAALRNPDDPRLVVYPLVDGRQPGEEVSPGIVALDITDAADLEMQDPTGLPVTTRQFAESAAEPAGQDMLPMGENVCVIDFSRRNDPQTRR